MSRPRLKPAAVSQAQRFAHGGLAQMLAGAFADELSDIELLERLDHNIDDLRSSDEESEPEEE